MAFSVRRRLVGPIALCAVALLAAVAHRARNLEHAPLDEAARHGAPGRFARLVDGITHYELTGPTTGRTIVLVSGMSVPYYLWDKTQDALAEAGYRVLRYDFYGRGLSDRPDAAYDLDMYDRQLVALLDSLEIRGHLDIAGSSMGGVVAADFANRWPERVRSLTLLDPGFAMIERAPFPLRVPGLGPYLVTLFAPTLAESQRADFLHPEQFPDWVARYREQMRYDGFRRAILRTLRGDALRANADQFKRIRQTELPVLLIWGREDHTVPFERSAAVRAAFPQAEFHAIDSVGHIPQYERPEMVNQLLLRFLRAH
jgi:pimeloyl-ACP methyl ester carboxylesterase